MKTLIAGLMMAGALTLSMGTAGQAQERAAKRVLSGEPAKLNKAMTQSQARRVCQQQMRGARESKAAIRQKMSFCVNEQMQGN